MVDYTEAAQRKADDDRDFWIEIIKKRTWCSEESKARDIEDTKKWHEVDVQINKAIGKVLSSEGPEFFNSSPEMQEKKLCEALMKEGVLKDKPFDDGSGSRIVFPYGDYIYPPATAPHYLSDRAGNIVMKEAFRLAEELDKDPLNPDKSLTSSLSAKHNSQPTVSKMHKADMEFIEEQAKNSRTFTKDSLDLSATTSKETQSKAIVSEEEFKALLAERLREQEKIKEFADNPNQRYYGEGLMAKKDPTTQEVIRTVDGQQVDKESFQMLLNSYNYSKSFSDRLDAGVQYGSLIGLYNSSFKDANGQYSVHWLTDDGNGGLKEITKEQASQIHQADKAAGKDVSATEVKVENYGGGLMHLKDQNGKSSYLNTINITREKTNLSYNMARSQIMNPAQHGGR